MLVGVSWTGIGGRLGRSRRCQVRRLVVAEPNPPQWMEPRLGFAQVVIRRLSEIHGSLIPPAPVHPLGCHRARIPNRRVMDAILLVLRTGMQWNQADLTRAAGANATPAAARPASSERLGTPTRPRRA